MHAVYILQCRDKTYYVGLTNNIRKRICEHNKGECRHTKSRLPVKLVWIGFFCNRKLAAEFENYLKTGSGNAFLKKRLVFRSFSGGTFRQ